MKTPDSNEFNSNKEISELHHKLLNKLTKERLDQHSKEIISLFRQKRHPEIQEIYRAVYSKDLHGTFDDTPGKAFLALIKTFHPDKLQAHIQCVETATHNANLNQLKALSRLLDNRKSNKPPDLRIFTEADEHAEFWSDDWAYDADVDFDDIRETESNTNYDDDLQEDHFNKPNTFLEALIREEPGLENTPITESLLQCIDGSLDLSGYGLDDLKGLEYCINLQELNLENNSIQSLDQLTNLVNLQVLLLSNNLIEDVTDLSNLKQLEELDLSFNDIHDFTPLFELSHLRILNLVGNHPTQEQLTDLRVRNITVIY